MYSSNCTLWYMEAAPVGGKTETERSDRRRQRMGSKGDREGGITPAEASAEARRPQGVVTPAEPLATARRAQEAGSSPGSRYAIRVEGLLDAHWSEWLGGMTLTHEAGGLTRLEGAVMDQAALHGLLNKIRDLRLTIVTLERLDAADTAAPSSQEPPESAAWRRQNTGLEGLGRRRGDPWYDRKRKSSDWW
jgi:hypothetical protein